MTGTTSCKETCSECGRQMKLVQTDKRKFLGITYYKSESYWCPCGARYV